MYQLSVVLFVCLCVCLHVRAEDKHNVTEGRGKGSKYALLTHLTVVLAAKLGLFKILVGIGLVVASVKVMVLMAWVLSIFRYVPDIWTEYTTPGHYGHIDRYGQTGQNSTIHFAWVVATKLFVLKLIYGAMFYALVTKTWHFIIWFIHYLKEKKRHHHHVPETFIEHEHYGYGLDHGQPEYHNSDYGYGQPEVYPYTRKRIYDSDGSYSVKN